MSTDKKNDLNNVAGQNKDNSNKNMIESESSNLKSDSENTQATSESDKKNAQSFWWKIKNLFPLFGNKEKVISKNPVIEKLNEDKIHSIYLVDLGKIDLVIVNNDASETKKKILERLNEIGRSLILVGEEDGKLGHGTSKASAIFRQYAEHIRSYVYGIFIHEKNSLNKELEEHLYHTESAKNEYNRQAEYAAYLRTKYRINFKHFNKWIGWMYIIFSLCLIVADLPLTFKVTKEVFYIKDNLLEELALSIGISMISMFIKIFYDEFMTNPIEKEATKFNKSSLPGVTSDNEIKKAKLNWNIRLGFKILVLGLCIFTIIILGIARHDFFMLNLGQNSGKGFENTIAIYNGIPAFLSFILTSILFPILGGILFSVGLDYVQHASEISKAKKDTEIWKKNYDDAQIKKMEWERKLENALTYVDWSSPESLFTKEYTDYFCACYNYGFERGIFKYVNSKDHFELSEQLRRYKMLRALQVEQQITANGISQSIYNHN